MADESKSKDKWSQERYKKALVDQRKFMWPPDTVDKLAAWFELTPGMAVADIGCGLGYVGYTYWKYFGEGGRYIGIDRNRELLEKATVAAEDWAKGGDWQILNGDAYDLPLEDHTVDRAVCQTVLMHLERSVECLAEMIRITKPGGMVICFEPDNLSATLVQGYSSGPELNLAQKLLVQKVCFQTHLGRKELGRGDNQIGSKLPHLMSQLGLTDIGIRNIDRVFMIQPPYETEEQQHRLKMMKAHMGDEHHNEEMADEREEFLAGGGDPVEWDAYVGIVEQRRLIWKRQLENDEVFWCAPSLFYAVKGVVPG